MEDKDHLMVGNVIKRLRIANKLTQEELAALCGTSSHLINDIENDKNLEELKLDIFAYIAWAFGMEPHELLRIIEDENEDIFKKWAIN